MQEVTVQHKDTTGNSQKNIAQAVETIPCFLLSNSFFFLKSVIKILPYFCPYVQFFPEAPKTSFFRLVLS